MELRSASLSTYVIVYFKVFFFILLLFKVAYKIKVPTMDSKGVSSPLSSICIVRTIICDHAVLN